MELISKEATIKKFQQMCKKIGLVKQRAGKYKAMIGKDLFGVPSDVKDLVIYDMPDGSRTSTNLKGSSAYVDGVVFLIRLTNIVKNIGCEDIYLHLIHKDHKNRRFYKDIYEGMLLAMETYGRYTLKNKISVQFLGDLDEDIRPTKRYPETIGHLKLLSKITKGFKFKAWALVNYSEEWAVKSNGMKNAPDVNVILRHTKGYVNGGMSLPGKLRDHSLIYCQNASSDKNWTDDQIIMLTAICLRSFILNRETPYMQEYTKKESSRIKKYREEKLFEIKKSIELSGSNKKKRVVIIGPLGPETYFF